MPKYYTDVHGIKHALNKVVIKNPTSEQMDKQDKLTLAEAVKMSKNVNTNVFWCLKEIDPINRCYKQAQYFLIPIELYEEDKIIKEYNADYWIGILYQDIATPSQKNECSISETSISGYDYEIECADYLISHGYTKVEVTQKSGDQGIDVIAFKNGLKYGFQCKYYKGTVPNKAVQEAYTGAKYYDCDVAVVMTTGTFSNATIELAHKIGVKLWTNS